MSKRYVGIIALLLFSTPLSARVFNINEVSTAAFIRGFMGESWTGKEAFAHSDSRASVDKGSDFIFGGEFGALVAIAPAVNLRLGAEVNRPNSVVKADGKDVNGDKLYTLSSQILAFIPQVGVEYFYKVLPSSRLLVMAGAGYAFVSLRNQYEMTSLGEYRLGFSESLESGLGTTTTYYFGTGWEMHFVDRTTLLFEAGYRYLRVGRLRHTRAQRTLADPSGASAGDTMENEDGSIRKLDLSSVYLGLSIRIFIF